jgi:gliding motility-associated-like protein
MRKVLFFMLGFIFSFLPDSSSYAQADGGSIIENFGRREYIVLPQKDMLMAGFAGQRSGAFSVSFPLFGREHTFTAKPNDVVVEGEIRRSSDILTFDLFDSEGLFDRGALTLSETGVFATLLYKGRMISIYPENFSRSGSHIVEYGYQADLPRPLQFCGHDHSHEQMTNPNNAFRGKASAFTIGSKRYNYRVAVVVTGEFYINNGNKDSDVNTVVVNTVNAINMIFSNEMSFRLTVGSRVNLTYKDPSTDIFIPDGSGGPSRPDQAGTAVAMHFQNSQYDIGHVFHQHKDGDGWGNGGIAQLNSVCNNNGTPVSKARGWSGSYSNVGNSWINLAAHEFGHQFGANHTFNGIGGSCTTAISSFNAYEIGSGTTIMSYNGICDSGQNIPSSEALDNYFHVKSVEEMYNYVYNGGGGTCGSPANSTNALPAIEASPCNATYTIPKNTPFYLKAASTFSDADNHTYCWEQIDEDGPGTSTQGKIGSNAAADSKAPLFRSYPPSALPERYFPSLNVLSKGGVNEYDVLPTVARKMTFNIAVRDNAAGGGAIANDDVEVTVSSAGPFTVSRPKGGETLEAGMMETFTWNTGGSNALCSNLRIRLSVDGGKSYSIVLAENIPYSAGTATVMIPANFVRSTSTRAMLECMDYDCFRFFSISTSDFTVNSTCVAEESALCPTAAVVQDEGAAALNLSMTRTVGNRMFTITRSIADASPAGMIGVNGLNGAGCDVQTVRYNRTTLYVTESGTYTFAFSGQGWASLHRNNYNPSSPCNTFLASTGTQSSTGGLFFSGGFTVQLNACTEYALFLFTYSQFYNTPLAITLVSGPGLVVEKNAAPSSAYQNLFLLVNTVTDKISYTGATANFTSTGAGKYILYSVVMDKNIDASTLVGTSFSTFTATICHNLGYNTRSIEILPACRITEMTAGTQGACVAGTNAFTQDIIVTYEKAPATGKLSVNGQLFDITGSPQTVTLTGLDSDGTVRDVAAFFDATPACKLTKTALFTAPVNCCPLSFDLGTDLNKCDGENAVLDAGNGGTSYQWKKDGIVIAAATTKNLTVNTTGTYEVEVTHSSGCKKTDKIKITFHPNPGVTLPASATFCEGETYTLTASVTVAPSVKWYKDGLLIPGQTGTGLQITQPGTYKAEGVSAFGCMGQAETVVTQIAKPQVQLGADIEKCTGEQVILNAGSVGVGYQWFRNGVQVSGATAATFSPTSSGVYKVVVTNAGQCKGEDEVKVTFTNAPTVQDFASPLINACAGTPAVLSVTASGYTTLQWFLNNAPIAGANMLTFTAANSGNYAIEAANDIGCKTRKETRVEVRALPFVELGAADIVACVGSAVSLDAGGDGTTYKWTRNGTPLTETTRTLNVSQDGSYAVSVTNQFTCSSTDQIKVSFVAGPTVQLNGDKTLCEGQNHTISVTTNAANPAILWYQGGNLVSGQTGTNLLVTQAGTYEVRLTGGTPPCEVRKSVNITVNPLPSVDLGADKNLCEGDALPLLNAGGGATSYAWLYNGAAASTAQSITADKSGTYKVTVKNQFGCEKSDEVIVTISPLPALQLPNQLDLCMGATIQLIAESNAAIYEWKKGSATIQGQSSKILVVNAAGTYQCIAMSAAGCKKELSCTVTSRPSPVADLGADLSLCPDEVKVFNAGTAKTYLWSDNSSASSITVNAGKPANLLKNTYAVTITNDFGCTDTDSVTVTLLPVVKATVVANKPGVCNGDPVTITASGGQNYRWTDPAGNTLSASTGAVVTAKPLATTVYTVEVTDGVCPANKDSKTIEIKVFAPVNINAGPDTCVVLGRTVRLMATGGASYNWDNKNLIVGSSTVSNPLVKPEVETTFTVTITDSNGCIFTDDVKVCVKADSFKPVSIITPNGDGNNDELYFGDLSDFPDNTLRIFNRWGNLIFEAEGYQIRGELFNGTRNGEKLPADTYYYILTFDDQVIKSALTILWE